MCWSCPALAPFRPGGLPVLTQPNKPSTWLNAIPWYSSFLLDRTLHNMITHQTLYTLANALGIMAMATVIGYHFVAVNSKYLSKDAQSKP
ncbi:hypothetical protein EDD18DRAFT_346666 [Armillaria luteobubalina]|uniref:Uncharacterized protein n=1 Tax=Armillaria luteobubalina TaxID=153913 RepID=A0AA39Q1I8_9AGAR|nr:hypothetical protein EDD18DRAFT_346666 [Armillaria luteobubalina]